MPSKKIKIIVGRPFLSENQQDAMMYLANSHHSLGSFFSGMGTKIGTGLNRDEINILMPSLIDTLPTEREFQKDVRNYFINFDVPFQWNEATKRLEINLEIGLPDNTKAIGETVGEGIRATLNLPLEIEDYVNYKHSLVHPWVAPSFAEYKSNPLYKYYIEDEVVETENQSLEASEMDKALTSYLSMKDSENELIMIASILNIPKKGNLMLSVRSFLTDPLKSSANSIEFNKALSDPHIKVKYFINKLLKSKLIVNKSGTYVMSDNGTVLATGLENMVEYMNNPENIEMTSYLKAQMKSYAEKQEKIVKVRSESEGI